MKIVLELLRLGFEIGGKCIAFDNQTWSKTGDIGDNSQFYIEATIIDVKYDKQNRICVDVKFDDGRISTGHFLDCINKINN